jgi:hypothetical protein
MRLCSYAGIFEFFVIAHMIESGMVALTRPAAWIHVLLEIPVMAASAVSLARSSAPITDPSQLSHVIFMSVSVAGFASSILWLYVLQPLIWPSNASVAPLPGAKSPLAALSSFQLRTAATEPTDATGLE